MSSSRSPYVSVRTLLACLAFLGLSACGGGGEGDGGGGGDSGGFTLGASTATFRALKNSAAPDEVRIAIAVTGNDVAAIGAAFVNQPQPSWLRVDIEGSGRNLTLVLGVSDTSLETGQYASTVTIGSADDDGEILSRKDVQVSYDLMLGMVVSATPQDTSFVFGSSQSTEPIQVTIEAPGKSWTITSNQPWLVAPDGVQEGNADLTLTLNGADTGQAPGETAVAQLTVQNTDEPIDRHVLTVNAAIVPPLPIVSVNPIVLGSRTGLRALSQDLSVSLDTGTNAYPWTLTFETPQPAVWVTSSVSGGTVSGVQDADVTLGLAPAIGAPGDLSATAHFDVQVEGQTFRTSVPITLKWHGQRLVPDRAGVAFSSFPSGLQPASRTLKVSGSRGVDGVPWTAVSNQSWLTATPSGVTGGDLVLVANPTGLAADQFHLALVTLASTSAGIERNETIRVGMWVGSTNPSNIDAVVPALPNALVLNPVEPFAYSLYDGEIHVLNVYTGVEVDTFTGAFSNIDGGVSYPISMDVSSDGSALYVANGVTGRVHVLNAATGSSIATYQSMEVLSGADVPLRYGRTNGYPVLWTPFNDMVAIDLEAGTPLQLTREGFPTFEGFESLRALAPDGSELFTIMGGTTSSTVTEYRLAFGTLEGRTIELETLGGVSTMSFGFNRQLCVSANGARLYTHDLNAMQEIAIDVRPGAHLREVLPPTGASIAAIECNWDGRLYVGLSTFLAPQNNLFVLDADGNDLGSFAAAPDGLGMFIGQMKLSGDGRRVVSANLSGGVYSLHFYDVPL